MAWRSRHQDGDLYGIFARHFTSSGAPTSGDLPVNSTITGSQIRPAVRSADEKFVVVWASDVGDGDSYGVFGRRFEVPGAPLDVDGDGEITALALFPASDGASRPPLGRDTIAMLHLAFRVDAAGFARAKDELTRRGIAWEFADHQVSHSIYFDDPDGHQLEITTYEV